MKGHTEPDAEKKNREREREERGEKYMKCIRGYCPWNISRFR